MIAEVYDVAAARERIRTTVRRTPLIEAAPLTERSGTSTSLKLECLQVTGSFKARGAASRPLALSAADRPRSRSSSSVRRCARSSFLSPAKV